jgi:hypothetical protein
VSIVIRLAWPAGVAQTCLFSGLIEAHWQIQ